MKDNKMPITTAGSTPTIKLSKEEETDFIKAMKIGYFKEFYKQGLITAEQLEMLIAMQERSVQKAA